MTETKLTPAGRRFFGRDIDGDGDGNGDGQADTGTIRLQQHHRRAVGTRPRGFHELLAGNQALLSHNGAILTFQGHPEKDARAARLRVGDAARWFGTDMADHAAVAGLVTSIEMPHDGTEVWARILRWAREGV